VQLEQLDKQVLLEQQEPKATLAQRALQEQTELTALMVL
jgi:hypothetical protein